MACRLVCFSALLTCTTAWGSRPRLMRSRPCGAVVAAPRQRPGKLHADKGYDHARCRRDCRARGIKPRIAWRGIDSSQRLGRHRWVIERTLAWFARFRRLTVRYERRQDIWTAFYSLAAALICYKTLSSAF